MVKPYQRSSFLVLAGAVLAYCATPWFEFTFDDRKQILNNPSLLHPGSIPGYFIHAGGYLVGDLSYYRPLFGTWMNLNYLFFGLHPAGWHITLLVLNALVALLCYRLVRAIAGDETVALLAALLFAVHPVHVESVAWVSGATDPLAAIFILLALLLYLSSRNSRMAAAGSWLAFAASLLCKETALLFPLLILVYELLPGKERQKPSAAMMHAMPYFIAVAAYLVLRIHVLGGFSHTLTPLSPLALFLTLPSVAVFYLRIFFLPVGLSPFYDTPYIRTASFTGFVIPVLVLLAVIALFFWWIRSLRKPADSDGQCSRQAIFFAVWTVLFLAPAFNLSALDLGEIAHDRYLYLPSIGFCALAAMALKQFSEKVNLSQPVRSFAIAGLSILLCTATIAQSLFWKDDVRLYTRGASIAPENINAQNNAATIYLESGDFERGIAAHQRILKLNPRFVDSYFNLGLAFFKLGDLSRAQSYLQQAIALRPDAQSYFYLGLTQFKQGNLLQAEQALRTANQTDPRQPDFHAALGVLYDREGKAPLAIQEMELSLSLNPQNEALRNAINRIKQQSGLAP